VETFASSSHLSLYPSSGTSKSFTLNNVSCQIVWQFICVVQKSFSLDFSIVLSFVAVGFHFLFKLFLWFHFILLRWRKQFVLFGYLGLNAELFANNKGLVLVFFLVRDIFHLVNFVVYSLQSQKIS